MHQHAQRRKCRQHGGQAQGAMQSAIRMGNKLGLWKLGPGVGLQLYLMRCTEPVEVSSDSCRRRGRVEAKLVSSG